MSRISGNYEGERQMNENYKEMLEQLIDDTIARLEAEKQEIKNEMCGICRNYAHRGACDSCKWRDK